MNCGYVVKIEKLRPHSNADKLQVATFFGCDTCVSLEVKMGDVGIYFPSDTQLGLEFCIENHLLRKLPNGTLDTGYLEENRHVRAIKLRGEKSDGIYLPLECLSAFGDINTLSVGDTISNWNNHLICQKYIPNFGPNNRRKYEVIDKKRKKKENINKYPYFVEHIDTPQLRFNMHMFKPGDIICLTEKIHGTSSRNALTLKREYKRNLLDKLFKRKGKEINSYENVVGTRRTIVTEKDNGFYGTNEFRMYWNNWFKDKLLPGETVYGEIAGFYDIDKPIMARGDNKKTKDKNFIKIFGDTTTFSYGCNGEKGESGYWIYRMTYTTPEGIVIEYSWDQVKVRAEQLGLPTVPELDRFIYTTEEEFLNRISKWLDIPSTIDSSHIIEGVVVRALNNPNFVVAKEKSYNFKVLEGIIKTTAEQPDIEEAEDV